MKKFIKVLTTCIVLMLAMVIFTACVPRNAEKAIEKMKQEGYSATSYSISMIDGATEGFTATEVDGFEVDVVTAIWFESVDDAKAFMEKYAEKDDELIKRKNKCVYYGTADAIEDFED